MNFRLNYLKVSLLFQVKLSVDSYDFMVQFLLSFLCLTPICNLQSEVRIISQQDIWLQTAKVQVCFFLSYSLFRVDITNIKIAQSNLSIADILYSGHLFLMNRPNLGETLIANPFYIRYFYIPHWLQWTLFLGTA